MDSNNWMCVQYMCQAVENILSRSSQKLSDYVPVIYHLFVLFTQRPEYNNRAAKLSI